MTRSMFLFSMIGGLFRPKEDTPATTRLQSVYSRKLETAEVIERLHWPNKPVDAWGIEEQIISGPYRVTEIRVKVMEKI